MPRDRRDNLVPNSERTPEEVRKNCSKGGKASVAARRKKKATGKLIQQVLAMEPEVTPELLASLKGMGYDVEIDGVPTLETMMILNVIKAGIDGDIPSIRLMYEYGLVPTMKDTIERERIKAQAGAAAAGVKLTADDGFMRAIAGGCAEAWGQTDEPEHPDD